MKYYKFSCSNGWCGCDEDIYEAIEDDVDPEEIAEDILFNGYSFAEPDGSYFSNKSWYDEVTEEEYDEYRENLNIDWEEITKEEYKKYHR